MDKLKKVINDYKEIETAKDLQKRKLTLADYETLFYVLQDLVRNKKSLFISKSICDYLQRLGLAVKPKGINFEASV